jgi:hypothetical protein
MEGTNAVTQERPQRPQRPLREARGMVMTRQDGGDFGESRYRNI